VTWYPDHSGSSFAKQWDWTKYIELVVSPTTLPRKRRRRQQLCLLFRHQ